MMKILPNNMKLIVTLILCVYWCGDAGEAISLWDSVRRFLEPKGSITQRTSSSPHRARNNSKLVDDASRRARRMTNHYEVSESPSNHHSYYRNLFKQKTKELEKRKHRFLVDKESNIGNYRAHKAHSHPQYKSDHGDEHRNVTRYRVRPEKEIQATTNRVDTKDEGLQVKGDVEKKVSELQQQNATKPSVRSGRYRDSDEEIEINNNQYQEDSTYRITKMVQEYQLQEEEPEPVVPVVQKKKYGPNRLNPYAINEQMMHFIEEFKDKMNITMEVIGRTAEYNNIVLLKITEIRKDPPGYLRANKYSDEAPEKKIIFIVHGLAVRGMGVLMNSEAIFGTIMSFYAAHLPYFDIFVIPIANPDGFSAVLNTHYGKFWNKNLSPQSSCAGVMLDRNFDVEWNKSHNISPCSHFYPGPAPFSEPETRAVRDVLHLYSQKIIAYIHVHASTYDTSIFKGDAVLFPRGYTNEQYDDDKYVDIKGELEETIKNATFRVISVAVETLNSWYGTVVGTSVDYAATVYGIPYSMEFSMQVYETMEEEALCQIWQRIIDVVFKQIRISLTKTNND